MSDQALRVAPDPLVVKRQNDLSDLWCAFVAEHSDESDYDPDDDPDFVAQARHIMGLPPLDGEPEVTVEDAIVKARAAVQDASQRQRRDAALAAAQQQVITGLHQLAAGIGDGSVSTPGFIDAAVALLRNAIHEGLRLGTGHALVDAGRATQRTTWATKQADDGPGWVDGLDGRFGLYSGSIPHAYELGYGLATLGAYDDPDNLVIEWHARPDACDLCDTWSTMTWTADTLPGMPGEGGFGKAATVCLGGPGCRCRLNYRLATPGEVEAIKAQHADRPATPAQLDAADQRAQDAEAVRRALAADDPNAALALVLADLADERAEAQRSWLTGLLKDILAAATRGANVLRTWLVTKAAKDETPDPGAAAVAQMRENYPPKALGWMKNAQWSGPVDVPLDDIDFDDIDRWAASHDKARVKHFAKQYRKGKDVKPVVAVQEPGGDKVKIIDGHHRTLAARRLGQLVRAYVGAVDADGGPWDETHVWQFHHGADPANKAAAVVKAAKSTTEAAGLAVRAADTGRVLMLQRALPQDDEDDDPSAGTFEMPGGKLEPGEKPIDAARREWAEETGCEVPDGKITGTWASDNGVYEGFVLTIPHEVDVSIFGDRDPDPDGDSIEAIVWWDPAHLADNPAVRPELADTLDRVLRLLPAPPVQKHVAGEPYHYRHGWIPVREDLHHFAAGDVATALHEDGSIHVTVHPDGAAEHTQMHAEDVPSLVEGIDSALGDVEAGHAHESSLLTTTGGAVIHGRPGGGITIGHGDASVHLTAGEAEQFAQHLDELATAHRPAVIGSHPVSPDLSFDVLSNDRIGVTLGESSVPEPVVFDATEAAELAEILRATRLAPDVVPGGEREPVGGQRLHPGLAVQWWSDGSASIDAGQTEIQIPAGHVATAAQILADLAGRLGPVLTAKGARLVRLLAKRSVAKSKEGAVGRYRARHLIRWFEHGEGAARIAWGTPGDFDRCVTIASEHMREDQAKGFCNLRHKGALGFYPATHAAMERHAIGKGHHVAGEPVRFHHGWVPVITNPLNLPVHMADPSELTSYHDVHDEEKLGHLTESMTETGWNGPPVIVHEGQAFTGSHRIPAAQQAGIEVPTVQVENLFAHYGQDLQSAMDDIYPEPLPDWMGRDNRIDDVLTRSNEFGIPSQVIDAYGLDVH